VTLGRPEHNGLPGRPQLKPIQKKLGQGHAHRAWVSPDSILVKDLAQRATIRHECSQGAQIL
jgi:hypothetical protein